MRLTYTEIPAEWVPVQDYLMWQRGGKGTKARMLLEEWLAVYESGVEVGPLTRVPRDSWRQAFEEAGYFHGELIISEGVPGVYTERLRVVPSAVVPDEAPTLYRLSSHANRGFWSWSDNFTHLEKLLPTAPSEDSALYVCRNPLRVYATITKTVHETDETLTATEYIVQPGEVQLWKKQSGYG